MPPKKTVMKSRHTTTPSWMGSAALRKEILRFKQTMLSQLDVYKGEFLQLKKEFSHLSRWVTFLIFPGIPKVVITFMQAKGITNDNAAPCTAAQSKEVDKKNSMKEQMHGILQNNQELKQRVDNLMSKLIESDQKRRLAYNLMQEQVGNIRVYCRIRNVKDAVSILRVNHSKDLIEMLPPLVDCYEFDRAFSSSVSQVDIFTEFRPLVTSFMDGYNVCFITYGGEASGKTYTLIGNETSEEHNGLLHRSLTTILSERKRRSIDWQYQASAAVIEVYNDSFCDFLSGERNIQIYVDSGLEVVHKLLKSVPITSQSDVNDLIWSCRTKRKLAKTALNPSSSRSHLIIIIRLSGQSKLHGQSFCSFMGLFDLAGFEDIVKADTQKSATLSKEAGFINRSLVAFNRMFVMLQQREPSAVSYRDSKLTHFLKAFLTNSGKCSLIITVRNDRESQGSTQNTLRFGKETRDVKLGKVRKQILTTDNTALSVTRVK